MTGLKTLRRQPVLARIGNTPLVELARVNPFRPRIRLFAKCEFANPGGSVKDRAALWMVKDGLESGALAHGRTILEATSGNMGISLAMIGACLGFPVVCVMPAMASDERKRILGAFGAEVVLTPPDAGQDGAILRAREIAAKEPARFFYPDQYSNPANPRAHYESTGPEIWRQTRGRVTHFIAGLGTSGTVMGTGRFMRERNPGIKVVGVEPASGFHGIEGLKHMETSIVPPIFRPDELDGRRGVETEDAYAMARRLAREEGLLLGQSAGAAVSAALEHCAAVPKDAKAVVVTVLADSGLRYLSTRMWES